MVSLLFAALIVGGFLLWKTRSGAVRLRAETENHSHRLLQEQEYDLAAHHRLIDWIDRLQQLKTSPSGRIPREELAVALSDAAMAIATAERAVLWLQHAETLDLLPVAVRGLPPGEHPRLKISPGQGPFGRAALESRPVLMTKSEDSLWPAPVLALPLRFDLRPYGLLALSGPSGGRFTEPVQQALRILVAQAAFLLGNHAASKELQDCQVQAVEALAGTIEAKDAYTYAHSRRTRLLARRVAADLHLPEGWIRAIEHGAFLHDLGKVGVPASILNKPGPLSPEEYAVMKKHPHMGARMIAPAAYLNAASSVVLYHHEWFNGQGYPEGLAGQEIPLSARLVQIVDAWDAMTSDRPYRAALSKPAAMAELRRCAGTQFDPKLVDVFLKAVERLDREGVPTTA